MFGKDTEELEIFYEVLEIVAPGAKQVMDIMLNAWQSYAIAHEWILPDGFVVHKPVKQTISKRIEIDTLEKHPTFTYNYNENLGSEAGVSIAAIGFVLLISDNLPLGRLPGDFHFGKDKFKVYIPITSCILLSIIITLIINFSRK